MRVYLDTNIIDWLLARPEEYGALLAALNGGALEAVITVEVEDEIGDTPEPKRASLEKLLNASVIESAPTHYPILDDTAIPDRMIPATDGTVELYGRLAALPGVKNRDPAHIVNAAQKGCTALVTEDRGILRKRAVIESLAKIEIITPAELLARLASE
jgi:predicted nucleic acid-binding protein